MKNQLYAIMDSALTLIEEKNKEFGTINCALDSRESLLNERERQLRVSELYLDDREQKLIARENAVANVQELAAKRKATIDTLNLNQGQLVEQKRVAEHNAREEREKRLTAEKALRTCLSDKAIAEDLLNTVVQEKEELLTRLGKTQSERDKALIQIEEEVACS